MKKKQQKHYTKEVFFTIHVVGEKMTRQGRKTAIYQSQILVISL